VSLFPDVYFQCVTYYDDLGLGAGDPQRIFDNACDQYVEHREEGRSARVVLVDLKAGKSEDLTEAACRRIAQWLNARRDDWPEWLEAELSAVPA